ncbi:GPI inositol-deacylase [Massilia solisilvae]|uniref:GPI inositol-deacylase n=1 Tax=Massilia solisilvae TaxID=1811225 RepID=A0ABT2BH28_9BURK|nr:GPI inositol-deacylase [Massilia solisilvae]MCS0607819.1 GPI inositol-deacylase [Massilia solisilvae]
MSTPTYPLPIYPTNSSARIAEGFVTPQQDMKVQAARFLPKAVLPVVFLPGIMGSNLRMSAERQSATRRKNNIAWRPDVLGPTNVHGASTETPADRQLRLDPLQTTVDIYDPSGPSAISGDKRNNNVSFGPGFHSPLLLDDPATAPNGRNAVQKARARGWGEVFYGSYGALLQHLESRLNNTFTDGELRAEWHDVIGVDPKTWGAHASRQQQTLTENELKEIATRFWFPVHAFGYNWLQHNGVSASVVAERIKQLINDYAASGYECYKVIVVTHSMGGLVGRALIHRNYGNIPDKVLGMVHGVMPAIGAPAAYKRMRAGFEDPGLLHGMKASIGAKVAGNTGGEVTAVLANAPGGLELLPTESYGNGWLRITHGGRDLDTLPKQGDPYNEIYKVRGKWFSLFREEWINPSRLPPDRGGGTLQRTCNYLDKVQSFHADIAQTFHPNSYAHYGADREHRSFGEVVWSINENCTDPAGWQDWSIINDTGDGTLEIGGRPPSSHDSKILSERTDELPQPIQATILAPAAPGDQTVPIKSADYQLKSGIFKGVFRQVGYEHQSSYEDPHAVASTLYSIVRIAQEARYKC